MARAASTDYEMYMGGTYPAGWGATQIDNLTDIADAFIDGFTYPNTISSSSEAAKAVNLQVTERLRLRADGQRRSSGVSSAEGVVYPDFVILTQEIKERLTALLRSSDSVFEVFDLVET